jgi:hypothetical protein
MARYELPPFLGVELAVPAGEHRWGIQRAIDHWRNQPKIPVTIDEQIDDAFKHLERWPDLRPFLSLALAQAINKVRLQEKDDRRRKKKEPAS